MKNIIKFFKPRNLLSTKRYKSMLEYGNGWYGEKKFSELLETELKRTYRTHAPLSLVIIDLMAINTAESSQHNLNYSYFLENFQKVINDNSREIDIKCADEGRKLKILLPDTSLAGAKVFVDKITYYLYQIIKSNHDGEYLSLLNDVKFITHPLNHYSGSAHIEVKPLITKKKTNDSKRISIKPVYQISWETDPSSSDTLVLPVPSFLQEIYADISNISYKYLKRFMDIILSTAGIILSLPVILIIALLIKCTSRGPILFKQKRLGYLGNEFTFLKFRTMTIDSDDKIHRDYVKKLIEGQDEEINLGTDDKPLYKLDSDPRITWVGQYLRKFSLDELPQFFNVLRGDMSIVGPRPPLAYEFEHYQYWHMRRVLEVKPGITGLWQVSGRSKTTFNEMVRLDMKYINNQSFLLDVKIILKTIAAVFNTDGAL